MVNPSLNDFSKTLPVGENSLIPTPAPWAEYTLSTYSDHTFDWLGLIVLDGTSSMMKSAITWDVAQVQGQNSMSYSLNSIAYFTRRPVQTGQCMLVCSGCEVITIMACDWK